MLCKYPIKSHVLCDLRLWGLHHQLTSIPSSSPLKISTSSNPVSITPDTRTWVFLFFSFLDLNGAMSVYSEGTVLSPMCGDAQHDYRERWDVAPYKGRNYCYSAQGKLGSVVLQQEMIIPTRRGYKKRRART